MIRELPFEEWGRLAEVPNERKVPPVRPENVRILVAEEDGRIVASVNVLRMPMVENFWAADDVGSGTVRSLLREAGKCAQEWGPVVFINTGTDRMNAHVEAFGGRRLSGVDTFVVGVE